MEFSTVGKPSYIDDIFIHIVNRMLLIFDVVSIHHDQIVNIVHTLSLNGSTCGSFLGNFWNNVVYMSEA
jgi:hypothetical protein